jgi:hypothetical protein
MQPKVVGWHYDYQLKLGAILNGASTPQVELQIQPGAPFALRGIGGYNVGAPSFGFINVTELSGAAIQFTDAYDNWLQTDKIGTLGDWPTGGLNAQYEPVYNQVMYQPGSVISVRVTNNSGINWNDARIVFRGTKLFYEDRIYSPCYPKCYTAIPYQFPVTYGTAKDVIQVPASTTVRNIPLSVLGADFVLRGGMITNDTSVSSSIGDLEVLLRSQDDRPYANDFIHWQWLFSGGLASRPGVWYPEIYLPKDRILLIDCKQGESALAAQFSLTFTGERIWPK